MEASSFSWIALVNVTKGSRMDRIAGARSFCLAERHSVQAAKAAAVTHARARARPILGKDGRGRGRQRARAKHTDTAPNLGSGAGSLSQTAARPQTTSHVAQAFPYLRKVNRKSGVHWVRPVANLLALSQLPGPPFRRATPLHGTGGEAEM